MKMQEKEEEEEEEEESEIEEETDEDEEDEDVRKMVDELKRLRSKAGGGGGGSAAATTTSLEGKMTTTTTKKRSNRRDENVVFPARSRVRFPYDEANSKKSGVAVRLRKFQRDLLPLIMIMGAIIVLETTTGENALREKKTIRESEAARENRGT